MKKYSKPVACIEMFQLDSEFAGGCAAVFVAKEDSVGMEGWANLVNSMADLYKPTSADAPLYTVEEIYKYNTELSSVKKITLESFIEMSKEGSANKTFLSALDNLIAHMNDPNGVADNLTSDLCYFAFGRATGKNFS